MIFLIIFLLMAKSKGQPGEFLVVGFSESKETRVPSFLEGVA